MNDYSDDYIVHLLKAINCNNDVLYDILDTSTVYNTVTNQATNSSIQPKPAPAFQIQEGTVKIGNLEMEVEQFETCLRYLMKITKDAEPENFV